jgi:hypothetical protein
VRLAILLSFAACGMTFSVLAADTNVAPPALIKVVMGSHIGYIVPENYAADCKADLQISIPGVVKLDGFWTPTELDVTVADRVLRDLIHDAVKDPTLLFPDLAPDANGNTKADTNSGSSDPLDHERHALMAVSDNYDTYVRQYVGIIIDKQKLIFCNYSDGTKADPSADYIFIHRVFVDDGTVHFLQCRFDPEAKACSNISMIGPWPPSLK